MPACGHWHEMQHTWVVCLPMTKGRVAMILEELGQGYPVGTALAEIVDEVPCACLVWHSARHETVPGCRADCHVGIRPVKCQRSVRKLIERWSVHE